MTDPQKVVKSNKNMLVIFLDGEKEKIEIKMIKTQSIGMKSKLSCYYSGVALVPIYISINVPLGL